MSDNCDFEIEIRCRFQGQVAQDLKELRDIGNFPSFKAAAEHIVGCFTGSMVRGLRQAQNRVEQLPVHFLDADDIGEK